MSADQLLLVIFGIVCGFALGHVQAWRFARKLEYHDVVLAEWDKPIDLAAPTPATITPMRRQSER